MKWKLEQILTDIKDRAIPQFYDSVNNEFRPQREIATQEELEKVTKELRDLNFSSTVGTIKNNKYVNDYKIIETEIKPTGFKEGVWYGYNHLTVYKSTDLENWEQITTIGELGSSTQHPIVFVKVSNTGRIIIGTLGGFVFVSDESGVFDASGPKITTGRLSSARGFFMQGNVIGINSYEQHGMDRKHEAYLSTDNGATFKKVFDANEDAVVVDASRFHLHDMEYDPYSGALYIWTADGGNTELNVSYDWGNNWQQVFKDVEIKNYTQIIATERGIALGSDRFPGGFGFIHVDRNVNTANHIDPYNFVTRHWLMDNNENVFYIASRRWVDRKKSIYLVPFYGEDIQGRAVGKIAFSPDGYNWQNLIVDDQVGSHCGYTSVVYGDGIICGTRRDVDGNEQMFVAKVNLEN